MSISIHSSPLLRWALLADATACAGAGLFLAAGAGGLSGPLGLPDGLLRYGGLALLAWAAVLLATGLRGRVPARAIWAIIVVNALVSIDALVLLATPWVSPSPLGTAVVLVLALVGVGLAEAQFMGMRRASASIRGSGAVIA